MTDQDPAAPAAPTQGDPVAVAEALKRYWRTNVTIMAVLLTIWAIVGLGCGVLFADVLNDNFSLGGYPLGFWFAQQGSIMTFVLIILAYCLLLNRLDRKHHEELERIKTSGGAA
ncbi:MAG: DUF4212 domain-containing protein [Phycisphaeraceae bacterium]